MWEMASPRVAFGKALVDIGRENSDLVVLGADLSSSTKTSYFEKEFPERFFNCGIAEANMMGVASGLAASGKVVVASTFAVFATGRCYDQIRQSIAYPRLNVKIVASHAGITVGGDGASHQTAEDIALMKVLPNMRVVVPADAIEAKKATRAIIEADGPFYMRMGRSDVPTITKEEDPFEIGKATIMRDGSDVALIGTGIMVSQALKAAEMLKLEGIDAMVVNMSTLKPLDEDTTIKAAKRTGAIVTAEEHSVIFGLGNSVAMTLGEKYPVPVRRVGIPDTFGESGEWNELMVKYGLTPENIVSSAKEIMKQK